jgi:hypothetical protein
MRNKIILFLAFSMISFCMSAQNIQMQKNGTIKKKEIKLPKRLIIEYKDSGIIKSANGKVFRYKFPYLFMKTKNDTLKVDVRNIITLAHYHIPGRVFALIITPLAALASTTDVVNGSPVETILVVACGVIFYETLHSLPLKFGTEENWSFY